MTPAQAGCRAACVHQQWSPDELVVEKALPAAMRDALTQRGHNIKLVKGGAVSQIVARSPDGKGIRGRGQTRCSRAKMPPIW